MRKFSNCEEVLITFDQSGIGNDKRNGDESRKKQNVWHKLKEKPTLIVGAKCHYNEWFATKPLTCLFDSKQTILNFSVGEGTQTTRELAMLNKT